MLIKDGVIDPAKISITTVYRYLKTALLKVASVPEEEKRNEKIFL
jgi:hypothetical protein